MTEEKIEEVIMDLKKLSRIYWKVGLIIIIGLVCAGIAALVVFFWQLILTLNLTVPNLLGDWSLRMVIEYALRILFWESLIVVLPTLGIGSIFLLIWWQRLPEEDQKDFLSLDPEIWKRWIQRGIAGVLAAGVVVCIGLIFIGNVVITRHFDIAIGSWTIEYVLTISILTGMLSSVLFGLPALVIFLIYWYVQIYRSRDTV